MNLPIQKLCDYFSSPHKAFPSIHVAGTNGKGSVCIKMARALQNEGYVTGLYTSPHIFKQYERIQINGELIKETEWLDLENLIREASLYLKLNPTFFEIATLIGFLYFQRKRVDIAVIETGLGGRLDATNIITPLISVITSIGYDHMDLLGPTLTDIAREKGGIIKRGIPVVTGADVPRTVFKEIAKTQESPFYQSLFQSVDFDQENQQIAKLCLTLLSTHFPLSEASLQLGLKSKPPCRFEHFIHKQKEIIFDVAHNAHGFARLIQKLKSVYPNHSYRFVVGFSKGKDVLACAQLIQAEAHATHLVSTSHPRLAQVSEIRPNFTDQNLFLENSIELGLLHALEALPLRPEVVVVAGTFFIFENALVKLKQLMRS